MFPYTHICFAADVLGRLNSEIVLGALFPDTVIAGYLQHADTHRRCGEIHNYLTQLGVFKDFAEAVLTHGSEPAGLDYYCDEKYLDFSKGYAFEMAKPLVDKVIAACRLPEEMGWWKAHNFIEMAADLWLYENRPEYHGYIARAFADRNMILALGQVLASFYNMPAAKMAMSFPIYSEYIVTDEVTAVKLAEKFGMQTAKKHGISIDVPAAANIIEEAKEMIGGTLPDFLDQSRHKVGNLVKQFQL